MFSVARMVVGFAFCLHGVEEMFGVLSRDEPIELLSQAGAAGVIELVAGALIMVRLYTPWVAFLASGEMVFAYFLSHQPRGFWPIKNSGERTVVTASFSYTLRRWDRVRSGSTGCSKDGTTPDGVSPLAGDQSLDPRSVTAARLTGGILTSVVALPAFVVLGVAAVAAPWGDGLKIGLLVGWTVLAVSAATVPG